MAWTSALLDGLASRVASPVYILEAIDCASAPYSGQVLLASAPVQGAEVLLGLSPPKITGPRVTPVSWSSTVGQWSVELAGDLSELVQRLTRGTVLVLKMGFAGWAAADFEIRAVGMVWSIDGSWPNWVLTCTDMLGMLSTRITTTSYVYLPLFYGVSASTTLSANYTAGDATLNVASTSGFERESGAYYGLRIEPTTGDPFYLVATGTSGAPAFTGVAAYVGTTAVNAVSGDAVSEVAYIEGHPLDIVRRLLLSTGGSANVWDDYPVSWGWGLPMYLVDVDDIEGWKANVVKVASGSYYWNLLIEEQIDAPGSWLTGLLADAGLFLTVRQGLLTCRAAQLHVSVTADPFDGDLEITDEDIVEARHLGLWDPTASVEYATVTAATATGSTTTTSDALQTLPAAREILYDVSDRVVQNESAVRTEMVSRLLESVSRIPEAIQLTLRGLWWSQLAPGSVPRLTTTRIRGRLESTRDGYDGRRTWVASVDADDEAWTTTITLLVYPTDDRMYA